MAYRTVNTDEWHTALRSNHRGRKELTLPVAVAMAATGADSAWYVAPFSTWWTVGRTANDSEQYHILLDDGEPIAFTTEADAASFVDALCALAAAWATQDLAPESLPEGLEYVRKRGVDLLATVWSRLPSRVQCYTCATRPQCLAADVLREIELIATAEN